LPRIQPEQNKKPKTDFVDSKEKSADMKNSEHPKQIQKNFNHKHKNKNYKDKK